MKDQSEACFPEETEPLNTNAELFSQPKHGSSKALTFVITLLIVSTLLNIGLVVNSLRRTDAQQDVSPYCSNPLSDPARPIFFSLLKY